METPKHVLLVIAIRTDDRQAQRRLETILAAASTYEQPPDTTSSVYAKATDELVADDADHLAHFIGWDGFRRLNVGDVVAQCEETKRMTPALPDRRK